MFEVLAKLKGPRKNIAIIAGVVVIVLVLIVVGYATRDTGPKSATTATPTPSTTTAPSASASPATTTTTQQTGSFYVLPELGIKFNTNSEVADLTYIVKAVNGRPAAYFSSKSLKAAGGSNCAEDKAPLGVVTLDAAEPIPGKAEQVAVIGSDYLNLNYAQAPCSVQPTIQQKTGIQTQTLSKALQSAQLNQ